MNKIMREKTPSFTITDEILSRVSSISEKIGRISAVSNLDAKPHLRKNNRIKSIHSSLKMGGISFPWDRFGMSLTERLYLENKKRFRKQKMPTQPMTGFRK